MTGLVVGALSCAAWVYLLAGRGGFWRARDRDELRLPETDENFAWPRVVAVVPARDEAAVIGETLPTLLRQDYRGGFSVIVVDDHSSDGTAAASRRAADASGASARLTVLTAPQLPEGWTGKLWAVRHGIDFAEATADPPEYFLLTDADIRYADDTLTRLIRRAVGSNLALTSLMAKLRCASFAERAFVPAFVFFFQMLYPFAWARSTDRPTAAAAGGCMLVRRRALAAAGGLDAIRSAWIDDCALARLLKRNGAIWLGLTDRVESIREYRSVADIRRMVIRCAYAQLGFRPLWLALAAAAMIVAFVLPPWLALFGSAVAQPLGFVAWGMMTVAFLPIVRFYGVSSWWAFALPAIALVYLSFTVDSAWQHGRGRGGAWKGRTYRETGIDR